MENPFTQGNYAPAQEKRTCTDLAVTGDIPEHLSGRHLRNGPNPASEIDLDTRNVVMGDGMVHGIRPRDDKARPAVAAYSRPARAVRAHRPSPYTGSPTGPRAQRLLQQLVPNDK